MYSDSSGEFEARPLWPQDYEAVLAVASNMQAADEREIMASVPSHVASYEQVALHTLANYRMGWILRHEVTPVSVLTFAEWQRGHLVATMYSTLMWSLIWRPALRWMRGEVRELLLREGYHHLSAYSAAFHHDAHKMLRHLGFRERGRLPQWGGGGEDFVLFSVSIGEIEPRI